ncbi:MAG: MFS transporter [Microbacteriaceae bacterium]|nr:MFS transporter [Microbacteriaceae bacterium]
MPRKSPKLVAPAAGPRTDPTRQPTEGSSTPEAATGIFSPKYLWVTLGSCALVFLGAFESLAVTTIMPVVSADLNGAHLYALAFAGPLATGVIGMVIAGNWSDRHGPVWPLYSAAIIFTIGLIIAGTASTMVIMVAGRLFQGLGTGAVIVALYVVVARVFPTRLHPSIFAGFAAAWVIPSLIGPFAAGVIAELVTWHWVFLSVVGLVAIAVFMIRPTLTALPKQEPDTSVPWAFGRIIWAGVAALAVLLMSLLNEIPTIGGVLAALAAIVAIVASRPLLPKGTLSARRGLPSVILLRGLAAAAFFGAEVYLPYLLISDYDYSPTLAGLALTLGSISWAVASWLQGRLSTQLTHVASTTIGSILVLLAILAVFVTVLFTLPSEIAIAAWFFGGGGMGLMYPRISTMTLAMSTPANQGFNSAAMSISDSMGGALALATTGIVFTWLASSGLSFAGVYALAAAVGIAALIVAPRVTDPQAPKLSETSEAEASAANPGN